MTRFVCCVDHRIKHVGATSAKLKLEWKTQMFTGPNNKVLLNSTGTYIQYPVINHSGKEYEKECIYIYV